MSSRQLTRELPPLKLAELRRSAQAAIEYATNVLPIKVACAEDSPDTLFGWLCRFEDGPMLYAYVAEKLRGKGVFRMLRDES